MFTLIIPGILAILVKFAIILYVLFELVLLFRSGASITSFGEWNRPRFVLESHRQYFFVGLTAALVSSVCDLNRFFVMLEHGDRPENVYEPYPHEQDYYPFIAENIINVITFWMTAAAMLFCSLYRFQRIQGLMPNTFWYRTVNFVRVYVFALYAFPINIAYIVYRAIEFDVKGLGYIVFSFMTVVAAFSATIIDLYCSVQMIRTVLSTSAKAKQATPKDKRELKFKLYGILSLIVLFDILAFTDFVFDREAWFTNAISIAHCMTSFKLLYVLQSGVERLEECDSSIDTDPTKESKVQGSEAFPSKSLRAAPAESSEQEI